MNENKQENSENRRALPKFFAIMAASLVCGGVLGFLTGCTQVFGLDAAAFARWLNGVIRAATPWGIPSATTLTMGAGFLLYRSAVKKLAAWNGGDEDETSASIDILLSWVLLLSTVQILINLFFLAAVGVYHMEENALPIVGMFILSCGLAIFAQQKAVDMTRKMNPEKHGSVYDMKFQKKWYDSMDESERQQTGQACYRAYMVTSRFCLALWLILVILGLVFEMSVLPVLILLLVWGLMQAAYTLECIRLSKGSRS